MNAKTISRGAKVGLGATLRPDSGASLAQLHKCCGCFVQRYSDAVAANAAAFDRMLEAVEALQAQAEAMRAVDPTNLYWGHAGSAASLANRLAALSRLWPPGQRGLKHRPCGWARVGPSLWSAWQPLFAVGPAG
jgi:hypothetical protein